jgi:hypothetical protein
MRCWLVCRTGAEIRIAKVMGNCYYTFEAALFRIGQAKLNIIQNHSGAVGIKAIISPRESCTLRNVGNVLGKE